MAEEVGCVADVLAAGDVKKVVFFVFVGGVGGNGGWVMVGVAQPPLAAVSRCGTSSLPHSCC